MRVRTRVVLLQTSAFWLLFPLLAVSGTISKWFWIPFSVALACVVWGIAVTRCNKCGKRYMERPFPRGAMPFLCPHCYHDYSELEVACPADEERP